MLSFEVLRTACERAMSNLAGPSPIETGARQEGACFGNQAPSGERSCRSPNPVKARSTFTLTPTKKEKHNEMA